MATVRHLDPPTALACRDLLEDVYLDAYAEPPYSYGIEQAAAFREQFEQQAQVEDFALVAALAGDTIVGFAHGIPFPAGRWWRYATTDAPSNILDQPKFAVIQFVVRRTHQGQGVGRSLMSALLVDRPEEYCILTSYPDVKARAIYDHWGWRRVGTSRPPLLAEMDALVLALKEARGMSPLFQLAEGSH